MDHYQKVVLCVDVMKVNKMPSLVTINRMIKFGAVAWLKSTKIMTILSAIKDVRNKDSLWKLLKWMDSSSPFKVSLCRLGLPSTKFL